MAYLMPQGSYRNYMSKMVSGSLGAVRTSVDLSDDEVNKYIERFNLSWNYMVTKSQGIKGFLDSILESSASYMDMFDNLNERSRGLNNEAQVNKEQWENIFNTENRYPSRAEAEHYMSECDRLVASYNKFYDLMSEVSSNPQKYNEMFETPTLWQNFVGLFLTDVPAAVGAGAGAALTSFGKNVWPIVLIGAGLLVVWKLPDIVRAMKRSEASA